MGHRLKDSNDCVVDQFTRQESLFVSLCARQLKLAVEESRGEMDGLTVSIMGRGDTTPGDVITRLQSVDRLMQRLSNVQANLERLAIFLENDGSSSRHLAWDEMLLRARATFTMEHERKIFDSILPMPGSHAGQSSNEPTLFDDEVNDV